MFGCALCSDAAAGGQAECQQVPRQNRLVKAAANALSPLAVDYAELW